MTLRPCVLCIGGHDPTGGAGLQADIETVVSLGARAMTLVTCLTAQDTHDVVEVLPTPGDAFRRQRDTLLADLAPDAVKVGVIPNRDIARAIAECLEELRIPVVVDPVLLAGGGAALAGSDVPAALGVSILQHTTLVTPNRAELRRLAQRPHETAAADELLSLGTDAVLVTGADEAEGDQVTNTLYRRGAPPRSMRWPRLPGRYHGSGCTLASACAARMAAGDDLDEAVVAAQRFTWQSLEAAEPSGSGQRLPLRSR